MNLRPSGYEPDELPGCSTPRALVLAFAWLLCVVSGRFVRKVFGRALWFFGLEGLAATYSPTS